MRNELPKISIITPCYNKGEFIKETIECVRNQNYPFIEHIIVDGGSTDQSIDIIKHYEFLPYLRWISEKDQGQSDAINKGMLMATGEIVTWLNSDDLFYPNAINDMGRAFSENSNLDVVYGTGVKMDVYGKVTKEIPFQVFRKNFFKNAITILQPSVFFKRRVYFESGGLDKNLKYAMDWDLFLRFEKKAKFLAIPDKIAMLRCYDNTKTAQGGWERQKEIAQVGLRHNGLLDRNFISYVLRSFVGKYITSSYLRGQIDNIMFRFWGQKGFMIQEWPESRIT